MLYASICAWKNIFRLHRFFKPAISETTTTFLSIKPLISIPSFSKCLDKRDKFLRHVHVHIFCYDMASSVSGQDKPNPALWLATWEGNMVLSCPLRMTRCVAQGNSALFPWNKSFIGQACSSGQDGWVLASFFFGVFLDLCSISVHKHAKYNLPVHVI